MTARLAAGILALSVIMAGRANAQGPVLPPDSAEAAIRGVLRAFYTHLESHNWEALSAYVLSPKLLERRGGSAGSEGGAGQRGRSRGSAHRASASMECPSSRSPMIHEATIRLDGDWAEVSVPRCSGSEAGVDEFRMLYFEERWRFIYTDLFEGSGQ